MENNGERNTEHKREHEREHKRENKKETNRNGDSSYDLLVSFEKGFDIGRRCRSQWIGGNWIGSFS